MDAHAVVFNIEAFKKTAGKIRRPFANIGAIAITTTEETREYPGRGNFSSILLSQAAVKSLHLCGLKPIQSREIKIKKTGWGLPFVSLSENLKDQALEMGVEKVLVSSTNDQGTVLCIAAALQKKNSCPPHPLGIGIDLLFYSTARHLLADCRLGELEQIFSKNELIEAYRQQDEEAAIRLLLTKVSIKEAVFKSLMEAFWHKGRRSLKEQERQNTSFLDVEVRETAADGLKVNLLNGLQDIAVVSGVCGIHAEKVDGENYCGALAFAEGSNPK